jgi:hypothetical protein
MNDTQHNNSQYLVTNVIMFNGVYAQCSAELLCWELLCWKLLGWVSLCPTVDVLIKPGSNVIRKLQL